MTSAIQPADLGFFSVLASAGSLSAAARELGITTPAVSKHLAQMEARLGVSLVNRTTRRMGMTPEGELYLEHARRILGEIDGMQELLGVSKATPKGLLRVNATLGFGRSHVAPLISRFVRQYPQVEVQLQLSVNPPALTDDSFDVCIRFGAPQQRGGDHEGRHDEEHIHATRDPSEPDVVNRHQQGCDGGRLYFDGCALIAVNGQPPRPYRVGASLEGGLVLQAVSRRSARLGASMNGPATVELTLPENAATPS